MDFYYYLLSPFATLLNFFYSLVESYGIAIICFAVVVKVCLFPFSLKGKRSMIQMNMMSAKMQKLQKQYGKDRERYNMEVQNLYASEGVNPMGGCLWSMLPMFVLIPLYAIIRQPLKYMMGLDEAQILQIANAVDWNTIAVQMGWTTTDVINSTLASTAEAGSVVSGFVNSGYNQLYLASLITEETLPAVEVLLGSGSGVFALNFAFLGLNLALVPDWKIWNDLTWGGIGLVVLVLISAVTGFIFSQITMRTNKMNSSSQNESTERTNKTLMYTMPLMSLWIGFVMPAGLCVYWIANNLLSMVQELIAGKLLKKDYEAARLAAEERERQEKEEERERKRKLSEERARRIEEEKNNRGKKKPAKKKAVAKEDSVDKTDSVVGIRAYARGRSYDPNRFDGVTPYYDVNLPADQQALMVEEKTEVELSPADMPETPVPHTVAEQVQEEIKEGAQE